MAPKAKRQYLIQLALRSSLAIIDLAAVVVVGIVVLLGTQESGSNNGFGMLNDFIPDYLGEMGMGTLAILALLLFATKGFVSLYIHNRTLRLLAHEEVLFGNRVSDLLFDQEISQLRLLETPTISYALTLGVNSLIPRQLGFFGVAVTEIVSITVLSIASIIVNPLGTFVALCVFALLIGIFQVSINGRLFKKGVSYSNAVIEESASIREFVDAHREITVLNRRKYFQLKLTCEREKAAFLSSEVNFLVTIPRQMLEFSVILSAVAVGFVDYIQHGNASSLGAVGLFLATGSRIAPSVLSLQGALGAMKQALGDSHTLRTILSGGILNSDLALKDKKSNLQKVSKSRRTPVSVEVVGLSVKYPESAVHALTDISFSIGKGQKVAVVGTSGAGKSTLVDAILGVINPVAGSVFLEGAAPKEFIQSNPGSVAYVPQSPTIIRGTILQNIALGLDLDELDQNLIDETLDMSQLDAYLDSLPNGLSTLIGESGATLSGGQRQRLGIARALLSRPSLLVLDEPTSALDSQTEFALTKMLSSLHGNTTVLVIAHRLSTIADSDLVLVIDEGRLLGSGSLEKLSAEFPHLLNSSKLGVTDN